MQQKNAPSLGWFFYSIFNDDATFDQLCFQFELCVKKIAESRITNQAEKDNGFQ